MNVNDAAASETSRDVVATHLWGAFTGCGATAVARTRKSRREERARGAGGVCSAATSLNLLCGARGKLACTRRYMRFRAVATSCDRSGTYSDRRQNAWNISGIYFIRIPFLHKAKKWLIIIIDYIIDVNHANCMRNVTYVSLYSSKKIHLLSKSESVKISLI